MKIITIENLIDAVLDLQDAGEMHGMTVREAAEFFAKHTKLSRNEINEAVERILDGDF